MKIWKGDIPKLGKIYAVNHGDYAGEMFIFIKENGENYEFLSSPKMENREVPKKDFDNGLKENIIEYIEKAPSYVRKTSKAKFEENMAGSS